MSSWTLWRHLPVRYQLTTAPEENQSSAPKHIASHQSQGVEQTSANNMRTNCHVIVKLYNNRSPKTECYSLAAFPNRHSPFIQTLKNQQRISYTRQWFPDASIPLKNMRRGETREATAAQSPSDHWLSTPKYESRAALDTRATLDCKPVSGRSSKSINRLIPATDQSSSLEKCSKGQRSKVSSSFQNFDQTHEKTLGTSSRFQLDRWRSHLKINNTSGNKEKTTSLYVHDDKTISRQLDGGQVIRPSYDEVRCEKCGKLGPISSSRSFGSTLRDDDGLNSLLIERLDYKRRTDRLLDYYIQDDHSDSDTSWNWRVRMSRSKHMNTPDSGRTSRSYGVVDQDNFIHSSVLRGSPTRSRSAAFPRTQTPEERQASHAKLQEDWNVFLRNNYIARRREKSFLSHS